jgi:putative flippase GtrA
MNFGIIRLKLIAKTVFRHSIVSICCGGLDYLTFIYLFKYKNINLGISYFLSFILATLLGFILHNFFTFRVGFIASRTLILYLIQSIITLVLGFSILYLFIWFNIVPQYAKALQLAVTFFLNVTIGRYVTFKHGILR